MLSPRENIVKISEFTSKKEQFYFNKICDYFRNCDIKQIDLMVKMVTSKHNVSLRIVDWFVTKYASENKIKYKLDDDQYFNVHISYEAQLRTYKKQYFDPFRRANKFEFDFCTNDSDKVVVTTLGQLNFFIWALDNKVMDYVINNIKTIVTTMNATNKLHKSNKSNKSTNTDAVTTNTFKLNISNSANSTIISLFD